MPQIKPLLVYRYIDADAKELAEGLGIYLYKFLIENNEICEVNHDGLQIDGEYGELGKFREDFKELYV